MDTRMNVVVVPEDEWKQLLSGQQEIMRLLNDLKQTAPAVNTTPFITAMEFMQAVRIGRTKFDQLVQGNRVKTIKKDRKIYVPIDEVERYFKNQ